MQDKDLSESPETLQAQCHVDALVGDDEACVDEPGSHLTALTLPPESLPERADKALARLCSHLSRTQVQRAFEAGQVWLQGKPLLRHTTVVAGDVITWVPPQLPSTAVDPVAMDLVILYEDKHLIAIDKPAGLVVHPGAGVVGPTLVSGVLHHTALSPLGGALRPGIVHRLDKDTTGVMVFAKSDAAYLGLIQAFAQREVAKIYMALVAGATELLGGSIRESIGRHTRVRTQMTLHEKGRPAHTDWMVQQRLGHYTWLRCLPHTGRTHQIRVHLAQALGCPIVGDTVYGYRHAARAPFAQPRTLLHATELQLAHPVTLAPLHLRSPLPSDFMHVIEACQKHAAGVE
jgi:23S rRNA pseudouridine1911/1915/1917 synthase